MVAGAAVVAFFVLDLLLPPGAGLMPHYWIPIILAAAFLAPLPVAILAALALILDIAIGFRFPHDAAQTLRLAVDLLIAIAAVLVAARRSAHVNARRAREQALRDERQHLADVIQGMNIGTWDWNVQTGETVFNELWARMIGYNLSDLAPISIETWLNLVHPDDLLRSNEELQRCFSGEKPLYECEVRMKHRDGRWIWVLDRGRVVTRTEDGKPLRMLGTHRDITDVVHAREESGRGPTDPLTGLGNDAELAERLGEDIADVRRSGADLSLLVVMVRDLEKVNEAHGRAAGDMLLQSLARACRRYFAKQGSVFRAGGKSIAIVLPGLPSVAVRQKASETIRDVENVGVTLDGGVRVPFTLGYGIAQLERGEDDAASLLRRAMQSAERS